MKSIEEIKKAIFKEKLSEFTQSDDGMFISFRSGTFKGMTVICSFAGGWEHVSINGVTRTPTWEEMCELKDMFWKEDECVVQYHPAKKDYVNNLKHCLHLWKPIEQYRGVLPIPDSILVGVKGVNFDL